MKKIKTLIVGSSGLVGVKFLSVSQKKVRRFFYYQEELEVLSKKTVVKLFQILMT